MQHAQVAIIGGGPAGLSTAGALKKLGLAPVVFDRNAVVGSSWLSRYDRLHLHTIRQFSGLAHFPIPRSYPKYVPRDRYAHYLQTYVERFAIDVIHDCDVRAVRTGSEFTLLTSQGEYSAQAVVIATGMYGRPMIPDIPGIDAYRGRVIHSSAYKTGRAFAGKRVLVVGLGNTGAEIAADLVEQGARSVAVSVRTAPPVVPRDFLGVPVQLFGIALSRVPATLADRIGRIVTSIAFGSLRRYGLPPAQWQPFSAHRIPVIDVGFVRCLKRGAIAVRPTIASFSSDGVVYANRLTEDLDAVIFATGFRTGLEHLVDAPGVLDAAGFPLSGCGESTAVPGLYFMGFIESHRGLLFEIDLASQRLARTIALDRRPWYALTPA